MFKSLKNLIFPGDHLCPFCKEARVRVPNRACRDCGEFIKIANEEIRLKDTYMDQAYYSCSYNRLMRQTLHGFKFQGKSYLYKGLGEILIYTMEEMELKDKVDAIIYVPLHSRRMAERGYNQSELLGKYVGENFNLPLLDRHLLKSRYTVEQSKLKKSERASNLQDSFKTAHVEDFKDKDLLLIDDIITTGATMEECARVLKEAGARSIYGLALTSSAKIVR